MKKWTITEDDNGVHIVEEDDEGNITPTTTKPTRREAVSRLMQLMNIGPVAPQTDPENICIGTIE